MTHVTLIVAMSLSELSCQLVQKRNEMVTVGLTIELSEPFIPCLCSSER